MLENNRRIGVHQSFADHQDIVKITTQGESNGPLRRREQLVQSFEDVCFRQQFATVLSVGEEPNEELKEYQELLS
jgi:hypothetical protein